MKNNVLIINAKRIYKCTYGHSVIFCNLDNKIFLTNGKVLFVITYKTM